MVRVCRHLHSLLVGVVLLSFVSALVVVGRAWAQDASPQATAVPLEQYVGSLRKAQQILSGSGDLDQHLARCARHWPAIDRVQLPSGAEITVSPLLGAEGDELTQTLPSPRCHLVDAVGGCRRVTTLPLVWLCWRRCWRGLPFSKVNRGGISFAAGWPMARSPAARYYAGFAQFRW